MDAKESKCLRVLMFPWLAHGHVFPYVELAKSLSKKNFHIYFCSTPVILDSIKTSSKLDSSYSIELVEYHLPPQPDLPSHHHSTKTVPPHHKGTLIHAFQASGPVFTDILVKLNPDLLIHDGFHAWMAKIASSHGVPPVFCSVVGSTPTSFYHHLHTHKSLDSYPFLGNVYLKGYEKRAMFATGQAFKMGKGFTKSDSNGESDPGFLSGVFKQSTDIVLMKSSRAVEGKYMDYLSQLCGKRIVMTGPLIAHGDDDADQESDEILKWLSGREERSTLYVSFGSECYVPKNQIAEIAKGLELSGVNFIWVIRSEPGDASAAVEELLPEGFSERTKEKGVVVRNWAPQAAILRHRSLGGFMTHCGWGSFTETIYHGVPAVMLPFQLEQPLTARVAVEAGIGVEVDRDEEGEFDGEGVAKAINEVLVEGREKYSGRVGELSKQMKVEEEEAIDVIVEELFKIVMKKKSAAA